MAIIAVIGSGFVLSAVTVVSAFQKENTVDQNNNGISVAAEPTSTAIECQYTLDDRSFGATTLGEWLKELLADVGAPSGANVAQGDARNTGTALEMSDSSTGQELIIYVAAKNPVDPELDLSNAQRVTTIDEFQVYFETGNPWKSMLATNDQWQLSLLAYPESGEVPWNGQDSELHSWFQAAIEFARSNPPPCSNELPD